MNRKVSVVEDLDGKKIVFIHDIKFKGKRTVNWNDVEIERYNVFHVALLVRHDQNGKRYFAVSSG